MTHLPRALVLAIFACLAATPAQAAVISELFFAGPTPAGVMPDAIEFSELAGLEGRQLEVLIIDASRPSLILRQRLVFTVSEHFHLISETSWPNLWDKQSRAVGVLSLAQIDEAPAELIFASARQIRLYDRPTGLVTNLSINTPVQQAALADSHAVLLDAVTFAFAGAAAVPELGEALTVAAGLVAAQVPFMVDQPGVFVVGSPRLDGSLSGPEPAYLVTPGYRNPELDPAHQPEPASLVAVLAFLPVLVGRRSREAPAAA